MLDLSREVSGRSVAVVGNSQAIFQARDGERIDGHDLVIRMNLGHPGLWRDRHDSLGSRTDIWCLGRSWPSVLRRIEDRDVTVVWMKLTALGRRELAELCSMRPPFSRIVRWSSYLEGRCRKFVGADPTTGLRVLWWLRHSCKPASVSVFGMDLWQKAPSHWSGNGPGPAHDPKLEAVAMEKLGW